MKTPDACLPAPLCYIRVFEPLSHDDCFIAVWGNGGRVISNRNGRMSGSWTWAESRSDGIDWALTLNTDEFPTDQNFVDLCTASITGWLDTSPTL